MMKRSILTTLFLGLSVAQTALAAGTEEQFFTIQLEDGPIAATAPVQVGAGQAILAAVWDHDDQPVRISVLDAETGAVLSQVETKPEGAYKVALKFPWLPAQTRHVLFEAQGKPLRAKVQIRLVDARSAAQSMRDAWGRSFRFGQTAKVQTWTTEPLPVTDAHTLSLRLFNRGGRAAVTVRGWDYVGKEYTSANTVIVEARRGGRIEIPGAIARGMAPLIPGGTANGLLQLEVVIEPLAGPADLTMTAEGQSNYGDVTLKRGYVSLAPAGR